MAEVTPGPNNDLPYRTRGGIKNKLSSSYVTERWLLFLVLLEKKKNSQVPLISQTDFADV